MEISFENFTSLIKTNQYEIILGLCTCLIVFIIAMKIKKLRSNFPPGPMGLPIVGYLPFLTKDVHLDFTELGKKYGDIFSVQMGSQDVVILHGGDVISEALNKSAFLGRPPNIGVIKVRQSSIVVGSNFSLWREQRKFVVQTMKDLGLGKAKIEQDVMDEIKCFMYALRNYKTQLINVKEVLALSISNNMYALIFGKRFEYNDEKGQFLQKNFDEGFETITQASLDLAFPWIHYIPFASKILGIYKTETCFEKAYAFYKKEMKEHMKTIDPANVRDFFDRYLLEIDAQREKNSNTSFNHNMLINNAIDLFSAGSETVRTSILWIIYIIAAFPDVQKKVQKEITEVIGSEKIPEYQDMRNMPYTHAALLEIMRWKTTVPLSIVRYTLNDIRVAGYHLPKGTIVFPNLWAVHHDPRYWDNPEKFDPERFLSKDSKTVVKPHYFMPFSRGGRACPGESMAYMEMFLYLTSILQEFDIAFPVGTVPNFDAKFAFLYRLKPYLVRFIPRY